MSAKPPKEAEHPGPLRVLLGGVAGNATVRKLAMSTPFVRGLAWRFVAGEDLNAGVAAARALNGRGIGASLNLVGTHTQSEEEAVEAGDAVVAATQAIAASGVRSHISLKLTLIGLDVDFHLCRSQLHRILDAASAMGVFVRIDMEESRYVPATIALFEEALELYGADRVGIVLQSYLRLRRDDLPRLAAAGASVRLVRGGYWETGGVVFPTREEVDQAFFDDIETLVEHGFRPAIATHDERAIDVAKRAAARCGRDRDQIEFQMLLGVRSDLAQQLADEGWPVRCYVPYGGQWYAYALGCIRRLPSTLVAETAARVRRKPQPAITLGTAASGLSRRLSLGVKRLLDITGALTGLVLLGPVLAWTAVAVAASMGFPVLFCQERPGKDGRPFTVAKFRTMRPPRSGQSWFSSDAERVTRLGRFLRATSLDELPELWNVLRGEMSLVGPRPLLTEYLPHYTDRERLRHTMRPGLTGWAAVNGRHTLSFEQRLELDAWYVEHWSLGLDARIVLLTLHQVLARDGVRDTQDMAEIDFPARFLTALEASPEEAMRQ